MMTSNEPIRLESLLSIAESATHENAAHELLSLCIRNSVRVYFPVPPMHVVAVHEDAFFQRRSDLRGAGPVLVYLGRACVQHAIKWLVIDSLDLKRVLDSNTAILSFHVNGGLVDANDGLNFRHFQYCVVRRDSPDLLAASLGPKPVMLSEGVVFPTEQEIKFANLFVSRSDGAELRKAIAPKEVPDKWNHKLFAPNIYRMYVLSMQPYIEETLVEALTASDKSGVFKKAVATTAVRMLKVDVRKHAEASLKTEKISSNEMNKDYSGSSLSKRMSLLLLATDCWIHDREIIEHMELALEPQRYAVQQAQKILIDPGSEKIKKLKSRLEDIEMKSRNDLIHKLHMKHGLRKYLEYLGFSIDQAVHLARIIKDERVGGVHVQTKKKRLQVSGPER